MGYMENTSLGVLRHWQRDLPWFAVWVGWSPREWVVGLRAVDDGIGFAVGIGLGPVYVGIGSYDRD